MGEHTEIGWTDHTFNPWFGCTKIAAPDGERSACDHCYAEAFTKRIGNQVWGKDAPRRFFADKHWAEPLRWEKQAAAGIPGPNTGRADHLVFCASMADVFEARDDLDDQREQLWELIDETPHLTWLLLTKRPEQILRRVPDHWLYPGVEEWETGEWPANVWVGSTVENQRTADLRIPRLLDVPAEVRFLSCEPLLGPVDLNKARWRSGIHWVIAGGESGGHHQPLNLDHARSLRDQCVETDVSFFFKQVGGRTPKAGGRLLDGRTWDEFPISPATIR